MRRLMAWVAVCLWITACQSSTVKVLVGATALVAPGAQPIQDAVIVISGGRIRSVGMRKDIPIPQDSERTNLGGQHVVPMAGGRLAPNEDASLQVLDDATGKVSREMKNGEWQGVH